MKKIKYLTITILSVFLSSACTDIVEVDDLRKKEDKASTAPPTVDRIVMATDQEIEIIGANFEDMVRIEGENLGNVTSLKFNDIEVNKKDIYSRYDMIIAPIPRILPGNKTDILYITTQKGSIDIPFNVSVPKLKITGLKNEFAQPGDTTKIIGDNFDLYGITVEEAAIKLGDEFVNMLDATRTELTIQIPVNAKPNSEISIQGSNMNEVIDIPYMNYGVSQLFDFNNWPGYGAFTHSSQFPDAPANFLCDGTLEGQPKPLVKNTKYVRFNYNVKAWGWMVLWAGYIKVPAEVAADLPSYDLRFEICTGNKYPISSVSRIFLGDYEWYPAKSGLPVNTYGGWQTISISADTPSLLPKASDIDPNGNTAFKIVFSPESAQDYDLSMCNFRFIHK